MDRRSSEFVSFLLVTICLLCGFASGTNGGCDYDERFESCAENRDHLKERMGVERIFRFFGSNMNMSETCRRVTVMRHCIKNRTSGCRENPNSFYRYKLKWPTVEKGIDYVCSEKLNVFANNKACLQKQEVVSKAVMCQDKIKHKAHRRYARHSCGDVTEAAKCVRDVVSDRCSAEAGAAMERTTNIFLALMDVSHDCDSDSGTTSGVSRLVLSSAFILAVLGWKSG